MCVLRLNERDSERERLSITITVIKLPLNFYVANDHNLSCWSISMLCLWYMVMSLLSFCARSQDQVINEVVVSIADFLAHHEMLTVLLILLFCFVPYLVAGSSDNCDTKSRH